MTERDPRKIDADRRVDCQIAGTLKVSRLYRTRAGVLEVETILASPEHWAQRPEAGDPTWNPVQFGADVVVAQKLAR